MTPTTEDLKTLFDEVSGAPPVVGDLAAAAAHRGRAVRRRRVAVAAACVAVAVAGVALPNLHDRSTSAPPIGNPSPTPTTSLDQPLPEYLRGGRLLASKEGTSARGITVTFTPTTEAFGFTLSCSNPELAQETRPAGFAQAMTWIHGKSAFGVSCGGALTLDGDGDFGLVDTQWVREYGVVLGQPVTVRFAFEHHGVHPGTQFRIGVYQAVPLDEFPFPEPPDQLSGLSASLLSGLPGRRLIFSGLPAQQQEGFTYTVPVDRGLTARVETVAPGTLRMYVDDRLVWTSRSWDYSMDIAEMSISLHDLGIAPGDQVQIRFEDDRFPPGSFAFTVHDAPMNIAR